MSGLQSVLHHRRPCGVALVLFVALFGVSAVQTSHAQGASSAASAQAQPSDGQQSPAPVDATQTTFRAATEVVALNVTVTDGQGRYVDGLSKNDFKVFEDGVPQDVTFFGTSSVPIDLAVMIDTSASMADKMTFVHEAATRFVQTLRPTDRAEILGFSDEAQVLVPFTSDKAKLERAIGATAPHGSTALYTSVYIALSDLQHLAKKENGIRRPAIVLLTDGDDTSSMLAADDLLDAARRSNVAVYTISIVSKTDTKRFDGDKRFITEADFTLRTLAQDTGGRSFFPLEVKDLSGVYQQIAQELASQYSLAYSPKVRGDGAFHRLFVRVMNHDGARPRTRTGYYAARPIQAALTDGR